MGIPDGQVVRRSHASAILVWLGNSAGYAHGEPSSITVDARESRITVAFDQLAHLHGWAGALLRAGMPTQRRPSPDPRPTAFPEDVVSMTGLFEGWIIYLRHPEPGVPA